MIDGKLVLQLKASPAEEAEFYRVGSLHGARTVVPKLRTPFLILSGTRAEIHNEAYYMDLVSNSEYGKWGQVEGTHFFPMEHPDKTADAIVHFWKSYVKMSSKL